MKILFELNGVQKLRDLHVSGRVRPEAVVLWHEAVDGPFPENMLASVGGLDRVGNALVVNTAKLAAHQSAATAASQAEANRQTRLAAAKTFLRNLDTSSALTNAQLTNAVKSILVVMKDLAQQID